MRAEYLKEFFKLLRDALFPAPRKKKCPYCGGGRCFGLCGLVDDQPAGQAELHKRDNAKEAIMNNAADKKEIEGGRCGQPSCAE